jgi:hypothetical protein
MLKPGDKIVCISNIYEEKRLIKGYIYTFKCYEFNKMTHQMIKDQIKIFDNDIIWRSDRFISLKEYRKLKILKLNSENN